MVRAETEISAETPNNSLLKLIRHVDEEFIQGKPHLSKSKD